ncbi:MAG: hypothetical protein Q8N60_00760 [Candidatus Diapherotrites archaeon]|nr:hypothetical protein [Candidatus Diapherotrites archaeon]
MPEASESEENEIETAENAAVWEASEKTEHAIAQKAERSAKNRKYGKIALTLIIVAAIATAGVFVFLNSQIAGLAVAPATGNEQPIAPVAGIKTFSKTNDQIETIGGKPVIRLFSTTWCPHCQWIKETFDEAVQPYVDSGKIVARHWELDIQDDTLTAAVEGSVPKEEQDIFAKFSPGTNIPAFVFGGKYYRIGNGYEAQKDLAAEKAEFTAVIEALLKEMEEQK